MKIDRIHHVAYRCKDAKETVEWYVKHLNMDFVLAIAEDLVPSTKAPDPYMHVFLDAGQGNVLAFFELPNSPEMGRDENGVPLIDPRLFGSREFQRNPYPYYHIMQDHYPVFHDRLNNCYFVTRYADIHLPMDEALTRVCVDISGRPFLVFRTTFRVEKIGTFDTELVREWFTAFAFNAGVTLQVETLYGDNSHHIAESCFKGVARALRAGTVTVNTRDGGGIEVPFGGYKQSGFGRDKSLHALEKYTQLKTTYINVG